MIWENILNYATKLGWRDKSQETPDSLPQKSLPPHKLPLLTSTGTVLAWHEKPNVVKLEKNKDFSNIENNNREL